MESYYSLSPYSSVFILSNQISYYTIFIFIFQFYGKNNMFGINLSVVLHHSSFSHIISIKIYSLLRQSCRCNKYTLIIFLISKTKFGTHFINHYLLSNFSFTEDIPINHYLFSTFKYYDKEYLI